MCPGQNYDTTKAAAAVTAVVQVIVAKLVVFLAASASQPLY